MCQFPLFETLAVVDGKFQNLFFHQQRVNLAFEYYLKTQCHLNLEKIIIPTAYQSGFFRCRIDYNNTEFSIEFFPYTRKHLQKFQCIYTENLDYKFKYSDRKRLDILKNLQSDEIIIVNNGFVSDCTIGNLLFLKKGKWYSPEHYLLKGTQLSTLLAQGLVELTPIKAEQLFDYEKMMVINALNPFDLTKAITIDSQSILL